MGARNAVRTGDRKALGAALAEIDKAAASILPLVPDKSTREGLREQRTRVVDVCMLPDPPGQGPSPTPGCPAAIEDLQRLLDGPLADIVAR